VRRGLLAWFDREKRRLPWRGARDPYRIWVSEVMLQQTTVGAVLPRYAAFLSRFPEVAALARARPESVLAAWSGLGYYARARHLHAAARQILRDHGGRLPRTSAALRELPGFGEYMAAAVASIAFGERVPAVDANVARVLSRLFALPGVAGTRAHTDAVRQRAALLLARGRPGDVTAALMDLGQLICTPRRPDCPACPLAARCAARRLGAVARFPARKPRPRIARVFVAAAAATDGRRWLLVASRRQLLRGLWLFPSAEGASPARARAALRAAARELGLRIGRGRPIGQTRHTIMHRRLDIAVYRASRMADAPARGLSNVRWLTPAQLDVAAIPTLTRRIAAVVARRAPSETP
jgi:A/G-specific adenine glycosylase